MSVQSNLAWALSALSSASKEELQPFSRQIYQVFQRLSVLLVADDSTLSSTPRNFDLPIQQTRPQPNALSFSGWSDATQDQPDSIDMTALPCWISDSTASTSFQQSEDCGEISLLDYSSASWIDDSIAQTSLSHTSGLTSSHSTATSNRNACHIDNSCHVSTTPSTASSKLTNLPSRICDNESPSLMEIGQSLLSTYPSTQNNPVSPCDADLSVHTYLDNIEAQEYNPGDIANIPEMSTHKPGTFSSNHHPQGRPRQANVTDLPTTSSLGISTGAQEKTILDAYSNTLEKTIPVKQQNSSTRPSTRRKDLSSILWERLLQMKDTLQTHLEKPVRSAVSDGATWQNEDVRIVDIKSVEGDKRPTFQNRFRKILAIRSLHWEFIQWRGPEDTKRRSKSQNCFVSNGRFSDPNTVRRAISIGKALYAVEKAMGFPTVSLLIGTVFWESQRVAWDTIRKSVERVKVEEEEFWNLLEQKATWFEACQKCYSDLCKNQNLGRDIFLREEQVKLGLKRRLCSEEQLRQVRIRPLRQNDATGI